MNNGSLHAHYSLFLILYSFTMIALFIGRFQPLHLGHLDALKQITENNIIIGIGSSQYSGTKENPYDFAKRKKMIESCTKYLTKKNVAVIAIPDIHDESRWVDHVKNLIPNFDTVYTGNDFVARLFKIKNYPVKNIIINQKISGTEIRQMMSDNNPAWKKLVPTKITNLL